MGCGPGLPVSDSRRREADRRTGGQEMERSAGRTVGAAQVFRSDPGHTGLSADSAGLPGPLAHARGATDDLSGLRHLHYHHASQRPAQGDVRFPEPTRRNARPASQGNASDPAGQPVFRRRHRHHRPYRRTVPAAPAGRAGRIGRHPDADLQGLDPRVRIGHHAFGQ